MLGKFNEDKQMLFAMLDDWFEEYGLKIVVTTVLEWIGRKA